MTGEAGRRVTWFFDFISPFAYLHWQVVRDLEPWHVDCVPVLFAGLLKHHGHKGPAEIDAKRLFTYRHALWRARQAGIPMNFPPAHPFNPLPALRLCIAAGGSREVIDSLFAHIWRDGHRGDDASSLHDVAAGLGIHNVEAAIGDPSVKSRLARNTADALAAGVFGVPTLAVDGNLFWGDDSTAMFRGYMADPSLFRSPAMQHAADLPIAARRK